jgi:predicted enzyme related to lactoylglutathione lyase
MDHTVVHFEIPADNPERATKFYHELFGWEIQKWASDAGPEYWMVSTVPTDAKDQPARGGVNGGVMRRQHPGHTPVNYISVESVDEYAKKARPLGAQDVMPKTPVKGMGWFAWLRDTEGNVFGIWETTRRRPDPRRAPELPRPEAGASRYSAQDMLRGGTRPATVMDGAGRWWGAAS